MHCHLSLKHLHSFNRSVFSQFAMLSRLSHLPSTSCRGLCEFEAISTAEVYLYLCSSNLQRLATSPPRPQFSSPLQRSLRKAQCLIYYLWIICRVLCLQRRYSVVQLQSNIDLRISMYISLFAMLSHTDLRCSHSFNITFLSLFESSLHRRVFSVLFTLNAQTMIILQRSLCQLSYYLSISCIGLCVQRRHTLFSRSSAKSSRSLQNALSPLFFTRSTAELYLFVTISEILLLVHSFNITFLSPCNVLSAQTLTYLIIFNSIENNVNVLYFSLHASTSTWSAHDAIYIVQVVEVPYGYHISWWSTWTMHHMWTTQHNVNWHCDTYMHFVIEIHMNTLQVVVMLFLLC